MAETKLTAQQRASLFAMSTRQNMQMLASQSTGQQNNVLQFNFPKARLLSKVTALVKATVKVTHASKTEVAKEEIEPYALINNWKLNLNNGFSPFVLSGEALHIYNMININTQTAQETGAFNGIDKLVASAGGTTNTIEFAVELPVTTSDRDTVGLIMLQNEQTNVTLEATVGNVNDMYKGAETGYTFALENITITPMLETFSIPANANAMPDLSVLKLCNSRYDDLPSAGQHIVKLSTGTIYKKLLFKIVDENGVPMGVEDITSNIDLVFNQADCNYSISPKMLRVLNQRQMGYDLPAGVYAFLFDYQGIVGMGGTRDFIDSGSLTEFWIRFNTGKRGKVMIITETLARLA